MGFVLVVDLKERDSVQRGHAQKMFFGAVGGRFSGSIAGWKVEGVRFRAGASQKFWLRSKCPPGSNSGPAGREVRQVKYFPVQGPHLGYIGLRFPGRGDTLNWDP